MLNQTQVIGVLGVIPKGVPYSMQDIYNFVHANVTLIQQDWAPYTTTRNTNVPHWHNVIQKTVFHLKEKGKVQYPSNDTYIF